MTPIRIAFAARGRAGDGFLNDHVAALRRLGDVVEVVSPAQRRLTTRSAVVGRRMGAALTVDRPRMLGAANAIVRAGGSPRRLKDLSIVAGILASRPDVVHFGFTNLARHAASIMSGTDLPTVVSCNGSEVRVEPLLGAAPRGEIADLLARADLVHCVSADLADRAVALGVSRTRIHVAPWGVDSRFFAPAAEAVGDHDREGPLRLISVGRLHWVKGCAYALDAVARLRKRGVDARLTMLGEPRHHEGLLEVLTAIEDFGLRDVVDVRGHTSRVEVRDTLRASDVFVLSSVSEGVSTATLEAMAVGLPVVVTDVGGMQEAVTDGVEGDVVPSRDPEAMADRLACLAADPQRRRDLGDNGRRRVERDFDVQVLADAFRVQYRRLLR